MREAQLDAVDPAARLAVAFTVSAGAPDLSDSYLSAGIQFLQNSDNFAGDSPPNPRVICYVSLARAKELPI